MKKNLRIMLVILSFALIIGIVAFAVSAEGGNVAKVGDVEYATLTEALDAVPDGGSISLIGDATLSATYNVTKSFTLDLSGYTLDLTATTAFTVNVAKDVTITGSGNIKLAGTLIDSSATAGVAYTFVLEGKGEGITVNHNGAKGNTQRIVYTKGGTTTFKNVEVVSVAPCDGVFATPKPAFHATSGSSGAKMVFENFYYYNGNSPKTQNGLGFLGVWGDSTVSITNSAIYSAGTILNVEHNTNKNADTVILNVTNSHLQLVSKDNSQRNQLVYSGTDDNGATCFGTLYFKDSYIGGNAYRAFYGDVGSVNALKIIFDHSVAANNGAHDIGTSGNRDEKLTRGVLVWAKNGSSLISGGSGIIMGNGAVWCEEGTRFSNLNVAKNVTWVDSDGNAISGVSLAYDPQSNPSTPYVGTKDSSAAYKYNGADKFEFCGFDFLSYMTGTAEITEKTDGYIVNDKAASKYSIEYNHLFQMQTKVGALTKFSYAGNTCFKYWISPTSVNSTLGSTVNLSSDPYYIVGDNYGYSDAYAPIASTKVFVVEFDIGSDSEYGYPILSAKVTSRAANSSNGSNSDNCTTDEMFIVNRDGSIKNVRLSDFNSDIKLPENGFARLSFVFYTHPDAVKPSANGTANGGQTYVFVDGKLLGYYDSAYLNGYYYTTTTNEETGETTVTESHRLAAYILGPRLDVVKQSQTVGSSFLLDNLVRRTYSNYIVDGESDNGAKSPEAYLATDIPKNNAPTRDLITVNGFAYLTVDEALKAAAACGSVVKLNGDVTVPQVVNTNGTVYTNGYKLALSDEGYGADVTLDGTTVTKYVFNSEYTATTDYLMYVGMPGDKDQMADDANYKAVTVKMGRVPALIEDYKYFDSINGKVMYSQGWSTDSEADEAETFVNLSKAFVEANPTVKVYPVITSEGSIAYYVKLSDGTVVDFGSTNEETNAAYKNLKDGETLVLCADFNLTNGGVTFKDIERDNKHGVTLDNDYTDEEIEQMKSVAQVIGLDLNGYKMTLYVGGNIVKVADNTIFNFYSSRPGAEVYSRFSQKNDKGVYQLYAQRMFAIFNNVSETATNGLTINNAHINVGKFGDIPGENLILNGGVLYEGIAGDSSCSINVDGVLGMRGTPDSAAAIMTRAYWGNIIVKNSVILAPTSSCVIDLKADDKYKSDDGKYPAPYVYIENTLIVNNCGASANIVSANTGADEIVLEYKNVISTGRFNPSNFANKRVRVHEGVGGTNYAVGTWNATTSLVTALCNTPIDLSDYVDGKYVYAVQTPVVDTETGVVNYDVYTYVVTKGYEKLVPEGANYVVLGNITSITAKPEDTVKVNYVDYNGKVEHSLTYLKGSDVTPGNYKGKDVPYLNALKQVPTNEWVTEDNVTAVTADVNYTTSYTVGANIVGIKANLSIYTDFDFNIYVPVKYKDYITNVSENAIVTIGEEQYIKVTVSVLPTKATDDVVIDLNVTEDGNNVTQQVKINVVAYAKAILAGEYTDADKQLMYYMLAYVDEAYKYFGEVENDKVKELLETYAAAKGDDMDKSYKKALETTGLGDVFTEATVKLTNAPAFVFTAKSGFVGTVTVTYGENSYTYTVESDEDLAVTVDAMKVYNFTADITVTAEGKLNGEDVSITGSYNLDTYAKYHTENAAKVLEEGASEEDIASVENSKAVLALIEALYDYAACADLYTK